MGEIDDIQAKIKQLDDLESWLEASGSDYEDGWSPTFAGVIAMVNGYAIWLGERAERGGRPKRETSAWLDAEIADVRRTLAAYEADWDESPLLEAVRKAAQDYIAELEAERRERGES